MPKFELEAKSKLHRSSDKLKHFVELKVDGVAFEIECDSFEKAMELTRKIGTSLGVGYKHESS